MNGRQGVAALGLPEWLIEVDALAAVYAVIIDPGGGHT